MGTMLLGKSNVKICKNENLLKKKDNKRIKMPKILNKLITLFKIG